MPISFKIEGVEDIQKALLSIDKRMRRKVVFGAMREGAKLIQQQAKRTAPRRTGRLRKAIKTKRSRLLTNPAKGVYGLYIKIDPGRKRSDMRGAYYGRWVDGGHKTVNGRTIPGVRFMDRAHRNRARQATEITSRAMLIGLKKARQKAGVR